MRTIYIDFMHHLSGKYGVITDKLFGFSPQHWIWYNSVLDKYLFDPMSPHNRQRVRIKTKLILAQVCLWIFPLCVLVWSVYVRYFHR